MKPLVIYHGGCRDGFCAAWVVRQRYPNADFQEGYYGQSPPDVQDRDVIVVDFSYPLDVMKSIADQCKTLLVLDHHKTAQAALAEFAAEADDHVDIHFDMGRSGAGMAWDFYFEGQPRPWIVDYVEDRDLWKWKLQDSKEVNAWLSVLPFDFSAWTKALEVDHVAALSMGEALLAKTDVYIKVMSKNARWLSWEGHVVPVVNAPPVDISELLEQLCLAPPPEGREAPAFAVGWFLRGDGVYQYSVRSRGEFDVSIIAKKYGGGGHKNAAGFQSPGLIFDQPNVLTPIAEAEVVGQPNMPAFARDLAGVTGGSK